MKILHLIYDDLDNPWLGGGGALRVYEICKRLAGRHDITIITGNYPGARNRIKDGIKYFRIGSSKSYFLSRLSFGLTAWKYIKGLDYDLIIDEFSAHSPCFTPLFTKKPVIGSIQNLFSEHALRTHNLIGIFFIVFEKLGLKLYDNFISVSPYIKKKLKNNFSINKSIKNVVIPNGIEEYLFDAVVSDEAYILFLGRIDIYQKGIDILIRAFEKVAVRVKVIELVIAGGGKDEEKLKHLIGKSTMKNRIKFIGRIFEKEKKKQLLSGALFVCMPSRFESWGMVAMEAAACGKAVIGTRTSSLKEVIIDGKTGILVSPEDVEGLAGSMYEIIRNDNLRKKFGKEGREWAKNYNWNHISRKQEDFYYSCLNSI
jgi:glycogen(starch) synthase